jgi:hypothetical protein
MGEDCSQHAFLLAPQELGSDRGMADEDPASPPDEASN